MSFFTLALDESGGSEDEYMFSDPEGGGHEDEAMMELYGIPDDDEDYVDEDDEDEDYIDEEDDDEFFDGMEDDEDAEGGQAAGGGEGGPTAGERTILNLMELINSGTSSELLARIIAPAVGGPASRHSIRLRDIANSMTAEERAKAAEQRRREERWWEPQIEPHPRGLALLQSGEFGRVGPWRRGGRRPTAAGCRFGQRSSTVYPLSSDVIPNTNGTIVASYPAIPYVGQYAGEDYGLFYTATQDFTIHLYNTAQSRFSSRKNPGSRGNLPDLPPDDIDDDMMYPWSSWPTGRRRMPTEDTSLSRIKSVQGMDGSWTITDCDADKAGQRMIYSSITPYVHLLNMGEDDAEHIELDFTDSSRTRGARHMFHDVGIWSIRFSADGQEVVAGARGGDIMIYDLNAGRRTLSVAGHADDVNAVCFADESSTNVLVSGSDDGYVKVWDRRSLSSSTPSGILVGATEGITYISPKGDGRYVIANSKDQAARLYDLRKMRNPGDFANQPDAVSRYGQDHFDYRSSRYPRPKILAHPKDCSVMTYRGHSVLRTLIRCHFSPRESTGQSYIYSGSADGLIHIWSLDGRVVQVLNRAESVPLHTSNGQYTDPSAPEPHRDVRRYGAMPDEYGTSYAVRDVAWHGYEPTLMSTCWEVQGGYRRGGTIAKHEWKGLGKGGLKRLEDWVERERQEAMSAR